MITFNETETETERDVSTFNFNRNNSTSVLDNQLDFSTSVPSYTSYTYPQQEAEEESSPSYEVEREYNIETLPEDEVIIPTFMPTLKSSQETKERNANVKLKLNARGKIIASVFGVVFSLLVAFVVYNAVLIGGLSKEVANLESEKISRIAEVDKIEANYKSISSSESIATSASNKGMVYNPESSDITISLGARPEIQSAEVNTNWFDKICEFFSEMFN